MKLHSSISGLVRTFSYFLASGTHKDLQGVSYFDLFGDEPSAIERTYAVLMNVMEVDADGQVLNPDYAQKRAAEYLRSYCQSDYEPMPPFEDWELHLHLLP